MEQSQRKAGKNPGRKSLVDVAGRKLIRRLYYDMGWTGKAIKQEAFPDLKVGTIQQIARVEQQRLPKEDAPDAATNGGATTDAEQDSTSATTSHCSTAEPSHDAA